MDLNRLYNCISNHNDTPNGQTLHIWPIPVSNCIQLDNNSVPSAQLISMDGKTTIAPINNRQIDTQRYTFGIYMIRLNRHVGVPLGRVLIK